MDKIVVWMRRRAGHSFFPFILRDIITPLSHILFMHLFHASFLCQQRRELMQRMILIIDASSLPRSSKKSEGIISLCSYLFMYEKEKILDMKVDMRMQSSCMRFNILSTLSLFHAINEKSLLIVLAKHQSQDLSSMNKYLFLS